MVSDTAMEAIDELEAQGLHLPPRDVVRLNAVGLRLEAARGKNALDCTYLLPRVAAISPTLSFRQPTIGHEIWIDEVQRLIEPGDYQTLLAVHAFALSRPQSELPDPDSPESVDTAVRGFAASCSDITRDQIFAAIRYVEHGADPTAGEHPASPPRDDGEDEDEGKYDIEECVALGVLNEGRAVLWGITEADMKNMTTAQLHAVIDRAYAFHKMQRGNEVDFWSGRFYATLDEIASRLMKEKHGSAA
jgi:hypothetical protein